MGAPESRVRTAVLSECGEGRPRAPRFAASVQHMRNRAGPATKTGSIAIAARPAAVYFRNLRKRDRSASTLAGILPMPAARGSPPFSLAFAIPARHDFRGADFPPAGP